MRLTLLPQWLISNPQPMDAPAAHSAAPPAVDDFFLGDSSPAQNAFFTQGDDMEQVELIEDYMPGELIEIHYEKGGPAPVMTLVPSKYVEETVVMFDGVAVAHVIHPDAHFGPECVVLVAVEVQDRIAA